jgi:hypothetical protein
MCEAPVALAQSRLKRRWRGKAVSLLTPGVLVMLLAAAACAADDDPARHIPRPHSDKDSAAHGDRGPAAITIHHGLTRGNDFPHRFH